MTETNVRPEMHWTTRIGVAGVVICALTIAGLNITGWFWTLPLITAIPIAMIALGLEALAFVLFEHVARYVREQRFGLVLLAIVGLIVAVAFNIEGGHRGIVAVAAPLYESAEADRRAAQATLDAERAAVQVEIAAAQARIEAASAELYSGGPQTREQNRLIWSEQTALDRAAIARLSARLDAMPVAVEAGEPFPAWGPYAVTSALAFLAVFGLTMFGVKVGGPSERKKRPPSSSKAAPAPKPHPRPRLVTSASAASVATAFSGNAAALPPEQPSLPLEPVAIHGTEHAGDNSLVARLQEVARRQEDGSLRMSQAQLLELARLAREARERRELSRRSRETKQLLMPLSYALRQSGMERAEVAGATGYEERTMTRHWSDYEKHLEALAAANA